MNTRIETYINDWFINISINKIPLSFYVIRNSLLKAINELKPKLHGSILDLACGVMPYKNFLMSNSIEKYISVDLEPTQYHNQVKPDFYWDGKKIPLEDSSCDFVIATEFLEHYFDTNHILNEINRVLKKGGTFFFTVPAIWPVHEEPYDYHRFTPYALNEHFKEARFTSWEMRPLGGFHYSLALFIALWNDNKISQRKRNFIRPLVKNFIKTLMRKDEVCDFKNGSYYSGIYGFVTK